MGVCVSGREGWANERLTDDLHGTFCPVRIYNCLLKLIEAANSRRDRHFFPVYCYHAAIVPMNHEATGKRNMR